jgi:hypothetical protein
MYWIVAAGLRPIGGNSISIPVLPSWARMPRAGPGFIGGYGLSMLGQIELRFAGHQSAGAPCGAPSMPSRVLGHDTLMAD